MQSGTKESQTSTSQPSHTKAEKQYHMLTHKKRRQYIQAKEFTQVQEFVRLQQRLKHVTGISQMRTRSIMPFSCTHKDVCPMLDTDVEGQPTAFFTDGDIDIGLKKFGKWESI